MPTSDKKLAYKARLYNLIDTYPAVLLITADNVGSKQMQSVRANLRGRAVVLMGKNTTIRKVMNDYIGDNPGHPIAALINEVKGNMGFVFTQPNLVGEVRKDILDSKVPAPARVGAIAPCDVFVEPGPTGCDPGQTQWFQALNIPTKISRGSIEIVARVHIIEEGEKVSASSAALCEKLNIRPFSYGLGMTTVYDNGNLYDARVLDLSEADKLAMFARGVRTVAAVCLELGYPTLASLPHSLTNAFKVLFSVASETDYTFAFYESYLANAAAGAAAAGSGAGAGGDAAAAAPADEDESSSDAGDGAGAADLFGGSDSDDDDDDSDSSE